SNLAACSPNSPATWNVVGLFSLTWWMVRGGWRGYASRAMRISPLPVPAIVRVFRQSQLLDVSPLGVGPIAGLQTEASAAGELGDEWLGQRGGSDAVAAQLADTGQRGSKRTRRQQDAAVLHQRPLAASLGTADDFGRLDDHVARRQLAKA